MEQHPIEGLMMTAMDSIESMIDVNTIIGDPIKTGNTTIIPISKICFGFAAGGSEFSTETVDEYKSKDKDEEISYKLPFGGGAGAGVNISPIAFLIISDENLTCPKILRVENSCGLDKIADNIPDIIERIDKFINKKEDKKKEETVNYYIKDEGEQKKNEDKTKESDLKVDEDE